MADIYHPASRARELDVHIRGLRYRVHEWGRQDAEPMFLLHGWADTGMSFQFLADFLAANWRLVAPDWRGFGDSEWSAGDYWFPDYLADLDKLLDLTCPDRPVRIVGHSMGGNIAWLYAGVRPDRVSHAVSLDAFGLRETDPARAPERYGQWLDELGETQAFSSYTDFDGLRDRVLSLAPMLDPARADFIARQWGRETGDGVELRHDPAHRRVNPVQYRRAEARACWSRIRARTLLVLGAGSRFHNWYFKDAMNADVRADLPGLEEAVIDAGHMLHLEQPERVAAILERFLRD